jgi:hypothetical protein
MKDKDIDSLIMESISVSNTIFSVVLCSYYLQRKRTPPWCHSLRGKVFVSNDAITITDITVLGSLCVAPLMI